MNQACHICVRQSKESHMHTAHSRKFPESNSRQIQLDSSKHHERLQQNPHIPNAASLIIRKQECACLNPLFAA